MKKFLKGFLIFFGLSSLLIGAGMMVAQAQMTTLTAANAESCQGQVVERIPGYKKCMNWQNICINRADEDKPALLKCRSLTEACMDAAIDNLSDSAFTAMEKEKDSCLYPNKNRT